MTLPPDEPGSHMRRLLLFPSVAGPDRRRAAGRWWLRFGEVGRAVRTALRGRLIPATAVTVAVAAAVAVSTVAMRMAPDRPVTWAPAPSSTPDRPSPASQPPVLGQRPELSPPPGEFVSWALLDLRTGSLTGSHNRAETSTTASMIKAWLAADDLRRTSEAGGEPTSERLRQLTLVIRDSDNHYTESIYRELGRQASIERLIDICGLTDSRPDSWGWSTTQLSARDTVRMGACLADGRAAGPQWTDWLLDEMRAVRGVGDFGIRHALPPEEAAQVAIKNGWVVRSHLGEYHVNCLAIGEDWSMAVLTRYPSWRGYEYGAQYCQSLASRHLASPREPAPAPPWP